MKTCPVNGHDDCPCLEKPEWPYCEFWRSSNYKMRIFAQGEYVPTERDYLAEREEKHKREVFERKHERRRE